MPVDDFNPFKPLKQQGAPAAQRGITIYAGTVNITVQQEVPDPEHVGAEPRKFALHIKMDDEEMTESIAAALMAAKDGHDG